MSKYRKLICVIDIHPHTDGYLDFNISIIIFVLMETHWFNIFVSVSDFSLSNFQTNKCFWS
jgi:hypothetical protein